MIHNGEEHVISWEDMRLWGG